MKTLAALAWLPGLLVGLLATGWTAAPVRAQSGNDGFAAERRAMVRVQLQERGIDDERVLTAMARVPRHRFVAPEQRSEAYGDHPLPIGYGQTIYQPYVVGWMTALLELEPGDRVLEIGTGTGYHTAVLAEMVDEVYTIEIIENLGHQAERTLRELGYDNVRIRIGDGYQGWPDAAPFDAVLLNAAPPDIPQPLLDQLAVGGRMVVPVGGFFQSLQLIRKTSDKPGGITTRSFGPVRVAPMLGEGSQESNEVRSIHGGSNGETTVALPGREPETGETGGWAGFLSFFSGAWSALGFGSNGPPESSRETATSATRAQRRRMVDTQIRARGLRNQRVLEAMIQVPRHAFVPSGSRAAAYADRPLPIGHGQTISQPYIVALMSSLLRVDDRDKVLEIGTGSGYHAAVLSQLAGEVYTIEIVEALGNQARKTLETLGYDNVHVRVGDGYRGWPEEAPFDAIILTAAPPRIPEPLVEQLAVGGRMVLPVGERYQRLKVLTKTPDGVRTEDVTPVRFVPMTGEVRNR